MNGWDLSKAKVPKNSMSGGNFESMDDWLLLKEQTAIYLEKNRKKKAHLKDKIKEIKRELAIIDNDRNSPFSRAFRNVKLPPTWHDVLYPIVRKYTEGKGEDELDKMLVDAEEELTSLIKETSWDVSSVTKMTDKMEILERKIKDAQKFLGKEYVFDYDLAIFRSKVDNKEVSLFDVKMDKDKLIEKLEKAKEKLKMYEEELKVFEDKTLDIEAIKLEFADEIREEKVHLGDIPLVEVYYRQMNLVKEQKEIYERKFERIKFRIKKLEFEIMKCSGTEV